MGIVAYFLHVDVEQLQLLREQPALVWDIRNDPRLASATMVDIDKDWQVLSWLVSEKKRKEQEQWAATMNVMNRVDAEKLMDNRPAYEAALEEERKRLGIKEEDIDSMPTDLLLGAIEGRGKEDRKDPAFNFGLGAGRVFSPAEVREIAAAFGKVKEADIRGTFDRQRMARFDVGGIGWLEEPESILDDFLLPAFRTMKSFYEGAAKANHHVIVLYQ